jgi:hypothetical protein
MTAPRFAAGDPVEPNIPARGAQRGVILARVPDGRLRVWTYQVQWAGPAGWAAWYPELQLRPAQQDDRGCYVIEVPLF